MYAVGMRFYKNLLVRTPSGFWKKLEGSYCPACGEKDTSYGICATDGTLYNGVRCVECLCAYNLPSAVPTTKNDSFGKIAIELRNIVKVSDES